MAGQGAEMVAAPESMSAASSDIIGAQPRRLSFHTESLNELQSRVTDDNSKGIRALTIFRSHHVSGGGEN